MPSFGVHTFGKELEHPFMSRATSRIRQELGLPEGGRAHPVLKGAPKAPEPVKPQPGTPGKACAQLGGRYV